MELLSCIGSVCNVAARGLLNIGTCLVGVSKLRNIGEWIVYGRNYLICFDT